MLRKTHRQAAVWSLHSLCRKTHVSVHKSCTVLVYTWWHSSTGGGWGMQAATEMQVIGLTLNRCDSLLERQTGSRNTTKHRAGAGSTPEEPFPASHGDNAENTAFKCNTQTEPAIKRHRVRHSSETDRVHEQRSTAAFYVCASGHLSSLICWSSQRRTRLSSSDSTMQSSLPPRVCWWYLEPHCATFVLNINNYSQPYSTKHQAVTGQRISSTLTETFIFVCNKNLLPTITNKKKKKRKKTT